MEIGRIGVITHPEVRKELLLFVNKRLAGKNTKVFYDPYSAKKVGAKPTEIGDMRVDLAVVCGGDGTLLWAAGKLKGKPLLLGVNTGRVGFLNEIEAKDLKTALEKVFRKDYWVEERSMLRINSRFDVLNELVILPQTPASLLEFKVRIDKEPVAQFRADGVLVSTQTGSTGHALSAGGPVIHPNARAYLIAPMISFMQRQPPMVVPDASVAEIEVVSKKSDIYLVLDGSVAAKHKHTEKVSVKKSPKTVRFVRFTKKRWKIRAID